MTHQVKTCVDLTLSWLASMLVSFRWQQTSNMVSELSWWWNGYSIAGLHLPIELIFATIKIVARSWFEHRYFRLRTRDWKQLLIGVYTMASPRSNFPARDALTAPLHEKAGKFRLWHGIAHLDQSISPTPWHHFCHHRCHYSTDHSITLWWMVGLLEMIL